MTDSKTPYLKLSLPHRDVSREENVERLQNALGDVDGYAARNDAALAALDAELTCKVGAAQSTAQSALAEFVSTRRIADEAKAEAAAARRAADEAKAMTGTASSVSPAHALCEFYYFRHPTLKPGFQLAQGGVIANAATRYPEAWAYLQTAEGRLLCRTEAEWQAMTMATWATLADGTKVGWGGIGGAPFYVQNLAAGTLRLPDLRGMYAEAAGFDALGVGGVHGDAGRDISGTYSGVLNGYYDAATGAFHLPQSRNAAVPRHYGPFRGCDDMAFAARRVVPVANKNQPRAWGALACVYLGRPAS